MPASDAILRFAEEPEPELPEPWLPCRRFIQPPFTLGLSPIPSHSVVSRVRTTAEGLDVTIAEVRAILRQHGYTACGWYVGPSSRPLGLRELLEARGFAPTTQAPLEPHFTAMTMTELPALRAPEPGVEARVVESYEEYVGAVRAGFEAAGEGEAEIAEWLEKAPLAWEHDSGIARMSHVGLSDGQIAGLGFVNYGPSAVLLAGGAVLPAFRGRGVYRALVTSRWHAAVAMGKPALTVHAGAMSRPILERCGFQPLCRVDVLLDPALSSGP
jgi:GNAT superfamily N-acetyltransferase